MTFPADPSVPGPALARPLGPPPIARPALTRRQRRAALTTGAISFLIMQFGATVFALAVGAVLIAWSSTIMFGLIGVADSPNGSLGGLIANTTDSYAGYFGRILITAGAIAVAAFAVGILLSALLLRRRGVNHPWGVTWAALAIGGAAASVVGFLPYALVGMLQPSSASAPSGSTVAIAATVVGILIWVATTLATGALSWWWMAHVMRPRS